MHRLQLHSNAFWAARRCAKGNTPRVYPRKMKHCFTRPVHQHLLVLAALALLVQCAWSSTPWTPQKWPGALGSHNHTFYCAGENAFHLELCQNREKILNKLYAADMLGYGKYNWWGSNANGSQGEDAGAIPGFDADFTNMAYASNTYLYAVRTLRIDAASDVWLCSDEKCQSMQDVGFVRSKDGSARPLLYTAAGYIKDTMSALPLVGKSSAASTTCEIATAAELEGSTVELGKSYGLCFAREQDVKGPAPNTFRPVMVPAYIASVGVEKENGPYGRLMVGTFNAEPWGCVRLILPRTAWFLERGWGKQHACANPSATLVFITLFVPGLFDYTTFNTTGEVQLAGEFSMKNLLAWQYSKDWPVYSRVLYCDDVAMSSAFSGANCYVGDMTNDFEQQSHDNPNWITPIVIEGMPMLAYNATSAGKAVKEAGLLSDNIKDFDVLTGETNDVKSTALSRWLYASDMLARGNSTVPWCNSGLRVMSYSKIKILPVVLANGKTAQTDADICNLLDSKGALNLQQGTKPSDPFSSILEPALIAWTDYTNEAVITGEEQYMGFTDTQPLPAGAVLKAMLEALNVVQLEAEKRAAVNIATADMTATAWGATLNFYAFTVLALIVFLTAGDFVRNTVEDVLGHKHTHWQTALIVFLPPIAFTATLMPAPVLALMQEINARKNNPDGSEFEIGYVQLVSKGYGDYRIMVITAYRTVAMFRGFTMTCAAVAVGLSALGVISATGLSWYAALKVNRQKDVATVVPLQRQQGDSALAMVDMEQGLQVQEAVVQSRPHVKDT